MTREMYSEFTKIRCFHIFAIKHVFRAESRIYRVISYYVLINGENDYVKKTKLLLLYSVLIQEQVFPKTQM